ncbi:hypothetical protein [Gordonia neofelifaecis]|uniref:Alkaline shock response membrane anchor protein AmaP n=1 Tax=Gordonia neofelifaecis NRRL B-59395 TaxID=644548 RepID=F1YK98_9ACTN|nr:hypothetical protein [Gordonia neofelifaecis]EGD54944.1 hypothetical protein SCNU_12075 [Gordonia neofelifaecis NRRL B-59395]
MNRSASVLHRLSIGVVGVVLVAVAVAVILYQVSVEPVAGWISRIDTRQLTETVGKGWFGAVLALVAVLAAYWGWRLIRTTIAPHRPEQFLLDASETEGALTISLKQVAQAIEEHLATQTGLRRVRAQALDDRGQNIIRITVDARPDRSYDEIVGALAPTVEDLRTAFAGSDIHVQAFVHLDALE